MMTWWIKIVIPPQELHKITRTSNIIIWHHDYTFSDISLILIDGLKELRCSQKLPQTLGIAQSMEGIEHLRTCSTDTCLVPSPPKVLLLCRSWGAWEPPWSQRLRQLEFWLLVGTTMLDRLWARGQTKCNTLLMLATSVFGRIHRRPCYVMAQPKSRLDIPWPNDAECMGHVWYHFSCWYPLLFDVESLAGCVGG